MRPLRIDLEGFMAYKQATTIDLSDVDFFSLSGPTGSGKSSLIDAMIFALYGRVPRLGARSVAPVISAGSDRARVLVEFEADGKVFTAVRSVKRRTTGANTDEVRLQVGDEVIASGADSVTELVGEVLSLEFDDFTKTVVLPQGEFAEFLEATPGQRQDLLRNLLDYDFGEVRALAVTRAATANERASDAEARLASLELPDEETMRTAEERLETLNLLADVVVAREAQLTDLETSSRAAEAEVGRLTGVLDRLNSIVPPERMDELDQLVAEAREAVEIRTKDQAEAVDALTQTEEALEKLPSQESVDAQKELHLRLTEVTKRLADLSADQSAGNLDTAVAAYDDASRRHKQVVSDIQRSQANHAAHALRSDLVAGDHCPVCEQVIDAVPDLETLPELEDLQQAESALTALLEKLRGEVDAARSAAGGAEAALAEVTAQKIAMKSDLDGAPPAESLDETLLSIEAARLLVAERRTAVDVATAEVKKATRGLEDASESLSTIGRDLMAAREKVADVDPPLPASDNPLIQWKELLAWSIEAKQDTEVLLSEARETAASAGLAATEARSTLIAEIEAASVEPKPPFAIEVTRAQEQAKQLVKEFQARIKTAGELAESRTQAIEQAALASSLAAHLKVSGFERWLMAGALADLVAGANGLLEQLSGGGYSLSSDNDGTFEIIDHRNADESRPVSTLSGGETFLASLALALSLAETLSVSSGAELNAIFLDEGFGTLDEESLDTVAAVLDDLAGEGLMVGVVTHVKELASRAQTRFEVRPAPGGSSVELVS